MGGICSFKNLKKKTAPANNLSHNFHQSLYSLKYIVANIGKKMFRCNFKKRFSYSLKFFFFYSFTWLKAWNADSEHCRLPLHGSASIA
jgi:hypothetical protein